MSVSGGGSNLSFTATAATSSGGNWLSVSPPQREHRNRRHYRLGGSGSDQPECRQLLRNGYRGRSERSRRLDGHHGEPDGDRPLPTIASVLNAASYAAGPVAPGEIIAIFAPLDGTHPIGPATAANLTSDVIVNGKLPTTLGGVQVLFNGYPAPISYAGAGQVNAIVPYEIASLQSPTVWVKFLGQTSNTFALTASPTAPAIFTANRSGTGPAALVNAADNSFNAPNNPAAKGSTVVFFVTGEGETSPASVTGQVTTLSDLSANAPDAAAAAPAGRHDRWATGVRALLRGDPRSGGGAATTQRANPGRRRTGDLPLAVNIGGNYSQAGVTVSVNRAPYRGASPSTRGPRRRWGSPHPAWWPGWRRCSFTTIEPS